MSKPQLTIETSRLSELAGDDAPDTCRICATQGRDMQRWQEHDHNDKPEPRLVVLCWRCAEKLIELHPRLYTKLQPNDPWPGAMAICLPCRWRNGTKCTHPSAKGNGGPGVMLTLSKPYVAMVRGRGFSGILTTYPHPPSACKNREEL